MIPREVFLKRAMPPRSVSKFAPTMSPSLARASVAAFGTAPVGAAVELALAMFATLKVDDEGDSFGASHLTVRVLDSFVDARFAI